MQVSAFTFTCVQFVHYELLRTLSETPGARSILFNSRHLAAGEPTVRAHRVSTPRRRPMATGFIMPAPDYELSPITEWPREHWVAFADQQLLAVRPCFSAQKALIRLSGRPSSSGVLSDGMEGFGRTFFLGAFRVAGEQGDDPHGHLDLYKMGLLEGTRPGSPEAWLPICD